MKVGHAGKLFQVRAIFAVWVLGAVYELVLLWLVSFPVQLYVRLSVVLEMYPVGASLMRSASLFPCRYSVSSEKNFMCQPILGEAR